jgi:carbon-monoxide dehydrogenase large subunit
MNTATQNMLVHAGSEVQDPPQVSHEEKPLHALTEDPRYIGQSIERPSARKLVQGQGTYIDDIEMPRMAHVCLLYTSDAADEMD